MPYRKTGIVGAIALGYTAWVVSSLTVPSGSAELPLAVVGGVAGGVAVTTIARRYRLSQGVALVLHTYIAFVAAVVLVAPRLTFFGMPTRQAVRRLAGELRNTLGRFGGGVDGLSFGPGAAVLTMALFWVLASLLIWGLAVRRPYAAVLPSLVAGAQLATLDATGGIVDSAIFVTIVGAALVAAAQDERTMTTGRVMAADGTHAPSSKPSAGAVGLVAGALAASVMIAGVLGSVPGDGLLTAVGQGGTGRGEIVFNDFVSVRQHLVNESEQIAFTAEVTGVGEPYFQLYTMDRYDAGEFSRSSNLVRSATANGAAPALSTRGARITANVAIGGLVSSWLPAPPVPVQVEPVTLTTVGTADGALRLGSGTTSRGMQYVTVSTVSLPGLGALAYLPDGTPTPLFDDRTDLPPWDGGTAITAVDISSYLGLGEAGPRIREVAALAATVTAGAATDYEEGLMLERWFHSPSSDDRTLLDGFTYSTDIVPGRAATDLAAWLLDPGSPNYHLGYCANFATAMGVMARTLEIPSRVVLGFAPGDRTGTRVVVRGKHAHAWVELWMPGHGWVAFDPTPRRLNDTTPAFEAAGISAATGSGEDTPPTATTTPTPATDVTAPPAPAEPAAPRPEVPILIGLVVVLIGASLVPSIKWRRRRRRARRLAEGDITAAWEEITARLTDLGDRPNAGLTPDEYAAGVDEAMSPLASVYGRSLYGPTGSVRPHHVETARTSFEATSRSIATRYTRTERLLAWWWPASLRPTKKERQDA